MSEVPTNERLWNSLVIMAKAKFKSWPSIPASKWVHQQYVQKGGRFADSRDMTAYKKSVRDRQKAARDMRSGKGRDE